MLLLTVAASPASRYRNRCKWCWLEISVSNTVLRAWSMPWDSDLEMEMTNMLFLYVGSNFERVFHSKQEFSTDVCFWFFLKVYCSFTVCWQMGIQPGALQLMTFSVEGLQKTAQVIFQLHVQCGKLMSPPLNLSSMVLIALSGSLSTCSCTKYCAKCFGC